MNPSDAEHYQALLAALAPVDGWVARISATANRPRPQAGSPMDADDKRVAPYHISHACWHSLSHAVDHLACLSALLRVAGMVNMYAPYTLVRGAHENACSAVWMLQPARRTERLARRLRFGVNDINHGEEAAHLTRQEGPKTKAERITQVRQIAAQCGVAEDLAVKTASYKEIVNAAGDGHDWNLLAWKLCSGIAHGDLWATKAAMEMAPIPSHAAPDVGTFAVSANIRLLIMMAAVAVKMTERGWQLFDARSRSPRI